MLHNNIFILIFLITFSISGQYDIETKVFYHIYNQNFIEAQKLLNEKSQYMKPFAKSWLECDLQWWKAVHTDTDSAYQKLQLFLEKKINIEENKVPQDEHMIMLYKNYLMRFSAMQNQRFKVLKYFYQIESFNHKLDIDSLNEFEKDIFQIFNSVLYISKSKLWIFSDKNNAEYLRILEKYTTSDNLMLQTLSKYFLIKIYTEILETPAKAIHYQEDLMRIYPNNVNFKTLLNTEG